MGAGKSKEANADPQDTPSDSTTIVVGQSASRTRATVVKEARIAEIDNGSSSSSSSSSASTSSSALNPTPICDASASERALFITDHWMPFVRTLRAHLLDVVTRKTAGYARPEIMPDQDEIERLTRLNLDLTAQWYGRGNLSAMFEWFMEAAEAAGETGYQFVDVPTARSADGWLFIVDGNTRRSFYKPSDEQGQIERLGGLAHNIGASPIDNTVLSNVMSPQEARILLAGGQIKRFVVMATKRKQLALLERLGLADASPDDVKQALANYSDETGLHVDLLAATGLPIASFSQFPLDMQENIHSIVKSQLATTTTKLSQDDQSASTDNTDPQHQEYLRFLDFVKANPGKVYRDDIKLHKSLLLLGMWNEKVAVVERSTVEKLTNHRFFGFPWTRSVDLLTTPEGSSELDVLRPAGTQEWSRFRKNAFPYAESHGLGLSGSGQDESRGSLSFEMGMPIDPEQKLGNWFSTDIEKILAETEMLNPPRGHVHSLPGEEYHDVGQNPQIGSSIRASQHTQITRNSLAGHPLYALESKPQYSDEVDCVVDIIQVGEEEDAFFVKFSDVADLSANTALVGVLYELRKALIEQFGAHQVDFNVKGMVDPLTGRRVVTFGPICMLERLPYGKLTMNELGDTSEGCLLPNIDTCSAAGDVMLYSRETWKMAYDTGRDALIRQYTFVQKIGARKIVRRKLLNLTGYVDGYGQAPMPSTVHVPSHPKKTVFSGLFSYEPTDIVRHVDKVVAAESSD